MGLQWEHMRFSNTEANVLPDDHSETLQYEEFVSVFGEEDNAIVLAVQDSLLFLPDNFNRWNRLSKQFQANPEVDLVLSTDNLQELIKDNDKQEFVLRQLVQTEPTSEQEVMEIKNQLFENMPFYENLLFNKASGTIRTVIYLDKDILNTSVRNEFILSDLENLIANFEQETQLDVRVSGMPYIKTWNSKIIIDEIGKFILPLALLPFALVGVSIVHNYLNNFRMSRILVVLFYFISLLFVPLSIGSLVLVAIAEKIFKFRAAAQT